VSGSLLDTSVLIALDQNRNIELPERAAVSIITLGELHAGVLLAATADVRATRQARLTAVQSAFEPLLVDRQVAQGYGDVLAVARRAGRAEKATDLLIIATAAVTGRTLHTSDARQASLAELAAVPVIRIS
jgi:predicted nucleic acid-binding protein